MSDYETEITRTIWNNKNASKVIVKPDGDSLGLIEITSGTVSILLMPEEARLVSSALLATAMEIEAVQ